MQRTVRLPLCPTSEQEPALLETARQFTEAFNTVCETGWLGNERNGVRLHHLTYRSLKDRLPDLVSDLHIQARVKATEALKSAFTRRRQGRKVSCPQSSLCSPRYNVHTFKLDWQAGRVKLSTTSGRTEVPFQLPAVFAWATEGKVCTADLVQRKGRFWLHVVIETPAPKIRPRKVAVGIDLGLCHPAVTSAAEFLGEKRWKEVEARLFRQKRQCQSKGSKSAKRRLRILRGRQARFRRDCDHILSKRIVESVPPGGTVVLENLTDIRRRVKQRKGKQSRRLHAWSFAQLREFVVYKAEAKGVRVAFVDPRHTSQTCSRCGHQHRSNRKSQSLFQCRSCGFTLHADLNGARNIRAKFLASPGTSSTGQPPSTGSTGRKTQCGGAQAATCKPPALAGGS
jgi:putative transposase